MTSDVNIRSYHVKHRLSLDHFFTAAKKVADYAVENKNNIKLLSSKYVKEFGLPSAISNQILRKYGRGTIKEAHNVNLIIPNQTTKKNSKIYNSIIWENGIVTLKPLKLSFRWNPGRNFEKINQVEVDNNKFMISVTFKNTLIKQEYMNILGIDHNCGFGRHILNCANLATGEVLNLGKKGPKIRNKYFKKHKSQKIKNSKEKRIMKDLDHKISRKVVDYALRRRFSFFTFMPEFGNPNFKKFLLDKKVSTTVVDKIINNMESINQKISDETLDLGPGYCIGHSFFCPTNNDLSYGIDWYKKVIDNQIIPLLEEYYFDRPEKVEELRAELLS